MHTYMEDICVADQEISVDVIYFIIFKGYLETWRLVSLKEWFDEWKVSEYGVFSGPYFIFLFCVVNINDEHTKPRFKRKVKFKNDINAKLCSKLLFERDWYFCNISESEWLWKQLPRKKVPNNHFLK